MDTIYIVLIALAFVIGSPLFAIMLFITALGGSMGRGIDKEFSGALVDVFALGTSDKSTVFSSIPLFIYAGYLMAASKTAERLVKFANAALGWVPGGLGIVTILACSVYTTFTGASGVTIVALGGLLMPALIKQKYPDRFSLGLVTGTGSVGLLFPPALPIILFGTIYGLQQIEPKPQHWMWEWETERFYYAGIVPGIVLVAMLSALVITIAIIKKVPRQKFSVKELVRTLPGALPVLLLPVGILAGLANGIDIPQVASLTVLYLLVVEMGIFRDLKPKMLWDVTRESLALIGAIFIIIYSATALTHYLETHHVPEKLVHWTRDHVDSKLVFLLALNVLLLLTGMVMDIFSAILIIVPLVAPVAHEYDVNPYHLGVIFLLNLEIGYLHPPIGLNLFISSFKFRKPLLEVTIATLPFMLTVLAALLVVTYVPGLTMVPPPTPRNTLGSLHDVVTASVQATVNVKEVTLPDGKVKKQEECNGITDEFERDNCLGLFTDVTKCRTGQGKEKKPWTAEDAKACEASTIKDWVDANTSIDDTGSFEDEDTSGDDGSGSGSGSGSDGSGSGSGSDSGSGSGSGSGSAGDGSGSGTGSAAGSGSGSGTGSAAGAGTGTGSASGTASVERPPGSVAAPTIAPGP